MRFFIILLLNIALFSKIDTKQIVLIQSQSWHSSKAKCIKYEKVKNRWIRVGDIKDVFIGKRGLAWGVGLHKIPKNAKYIKKEGDQKTPAGIFRLSILYSYNKLKLNFPNLVSKKNYYCIDDSNSKYYNMVIDSKKLVKDYNSFERMKFPKNYYKYALAIDHNYFNSKNSIKQRGSCIFFHIFPQATVGCTAFRDENDMLNLIKWLDVKKNPLIIQAPKSEIKKLLKKIKDFNE